ERLGTIEAGKLAYLTVVEGKNYFDPEAKVREVWIDGKIHKAPSEEPKPGKGDETRGAKPASEEKDTAKSKEEPERKVAEKSKVEKPEEKKELDKDDKPADEKKDKKKEETRELQKKRLARSPMEGRGPMAEPKTVLIQNATVWTCANEGRIENADVLIVGGKIKGVAKGLRPDTGESPLLID